MPDSQGGIRDPSPTLTTGINVRRGHSPPGDLISIPEVTIGVNPRRKVVCPRDSPHHSNHADYRASFRNRFDGSGFGRVGFLNPDRVFSARVLLAALAKPV